MSEARRRDLPVLALVLLCFVAAVAPGQNKAQRPVLRAPTGAELRVAGEDGAPAIGSPAPGRSKQPELAGVARIWGQAQHSGFTDLVRFQNRWYCTFREGSEHISPDGWIRVISSADGESWAPSAVIGTDVADLRDPKLCVTPDRRLMLSAAAFYREPTAVKIQTLAWYSLDGRDWGTAFKIGDPELWLWRVNWHRSNAYSMAYSAGEESSLRMYASPGGLRFQVLADKVVSEAAPTEASLLFNSDDSALCLLRRDGGKGTAMLGRSRPPYRAWTWQDLGMRLGGPNMIRLPDGKVVAVVRLSDGRERTALCWIGEEDGTLTEFLTLPSGGDTSYPGLAWHDGLLWVSYHSSHEGRTAIYLARVRFPPVEEPDAKAH